MQLMDEPFLEKAVAFFLEIQTTLKTHLRFKLDKDDDADRHQEERNGGTNQRAKKWSQLNQDRFRWG